VRQWNVFMVGLCSSVLGRSSWRSQESATKSQRMDDNHAEKGCVRLTACLELFPDRFTE
jgi:hypothetical protein